MGFFCNISIIFIFQIFAQIHYLYNNQTIMKAGDQTLVKVHGRCSCVNRGRNFEMNFFSLGNIAIGLHWLQ